MRCPSTRVEVPRRRSAIQTESLPHRLVILDPLPHRPAVNGEHETRVAHHSTRPSRKPDRPGLSLESGRKDTVSSRVRGARIWCLSVLSELPGKSAFMRPKGSAIQVDDGEDCTPIKVRLLLQFETGRGALILAMSGPSPGLPNTFQAQEQDFFPL